MYVLFYCYKVLLIFCVFQSVWSSISLEIVDNYRPRSRGDNAFGSVHVHVCPYVCGHSPVWTIWPLTLILDMRVDFDLG